MKRFISIFLLAFIGFAAGCASRSLSFDVHPHVEGFPDVMAIQQQSSESSNNKLNEDLRVQVDNNQTLLDMAKKNENALDWYKNNEWQFNRDDPNKPPQIGLALSGGGMRSASFNLGVMQGLAEIGVFDKIDIMSSVSGGGYAMSWYYLQQFYQDGIICNETLFKDEKKYQKYLASHGELVSQTLNIPWRWLDYTTKGTASIAFIPFNIVANGLFGWHLNLVPMRRFYQNGIERVYQLVPLDESGATANAMKSFSLFTIGVKKQASFYKLCKFIKSKKLPYFIVNTTANIEDANEPRSARLAARVFEFTPLRYGSDYFGYENVTSKDQSTSFNKAISISGAAIDSNYIHGHAEQMFLSALNMDLGYYISNLDKNISTGEKILNNILPLPFYAFSGHYQKDVNGTSIYLTDGGHVENLGAYSLVKRLCRNIIIVDADHDPDYQFRAYNILKRALKSEMSVDLTVPDIDDVINKKNVFYGSNPVMTGCISYFPVLENNDKVKAVSLKVIYIKLSLNEEIFIKNEMYKKTTMHRYYINHKEDDRNYIDSHGPFPQQGTEDQTYDEEQVLAYKDLGYLIVKNNEKIFSGLLWASHNDDN